MQVLHRRVQHVSEILEHVTTQLRIPFEGLVAITMANVGHLRGCFLNPLHDIFGFSSCRHLKSVACHGLFDERACCLAERRGTLLFVTSAMVVMKSHLDA